MANFANQDSTRNTNVFKPKRISRTPVLFPQTCFLDNEIRSDASTEIFAEMEFSTTRKKSSEKSRDSSTLEKSDILCEEAKSNEIDSNVCVTTEEATQPSINSTTVLDSDFVRVSASESVPQTILASQDNGENEQEIAALCQMSVNIGGDPAAGATGVNSPGVIWLNSATESPMTIEMLKNPEDLLKLLNRHSQEIKRLQGMPLFSDFYFIHFLDSKILQWHFD